MMRRAALATTEGADGTLAVALPLPTLAERLLSDHSSPSRRRRRLAVVSIVVTEW